MVSVVALLGRVARRIEETSEKVCPTSVRAAGKRMQDSESITLYSIIKTEISDRFSYLPFADNFYISLLKQKFAKTFRRVQKCFYNHFQELLPLLFSFLQNIISMC